MRNTFSNIFRRHHFSPWKINIELIPKTCINSTRVNRNNFTKTLNKSACPYDPLRTYSLPLYLADFRISSFPPLVRNWMSVAYMPNEWTSSLVVDREGELCVNVRHKNNRMASAMCKSPSCSCTLSGEPACWMNAGPSAANTAYIQQFPSGATLVSFNPKQLHKSS